MAETTPRLPNVLVIMTDQHRHDLMSCAGNGPVPTPNIDRIAARGVRFSNAYCPYPVCVASRMAMLTGLYAHTTGAINNTDRLDWRYRCMPHHFAENGYLTGLIGKMHFNDAHKHGFEYYLSVNDWLMYLGPKVRHFADEIGNHPLNPHFFDTMIDDGAGMPDVSGLWDGPSPWVGQVQPYAYDSMASRLEADDHLDAFIARETGRFLERYREQPFFLVASLMKPHTPFYPPREFADRYPVDAMVLPDPGDLSGYPPHLQRRMHGTLAIPEQRRKAALAGYLGNLAFADVCVGRILDALEAQGLAEDTIVVYTSDHGDMTGDHGLFQKFCLFDPAAKVPLIVSDPSRLPCGETSAARVELVGLYPTLAELAGLPPPARTVLAPFPDAATELDGRSFADCVRDPAAPGPDTAFCEFDLRGAMPRYMLRSSRYKLVYNDGGRHELYDLESDPGECVNRAEDPAFESILRELTEALFRRFDPGCNRFARNA